MVELNKEVVEAVVAALPEPVRRCLRMSRLLLAGGFIRAIVAGEEPKDVDIWVSSKEEAERWSKLLASSLKKGRFHSRNAISINLSGKPIQFVTRWMYPDPEKLIGSFDFTIAQAVVWWSEEGWKGLCAESFFEDVTWKKLVYTSPVRDEDAAGSLLRVKKFLGRGYVISDEDLALVVARVGEAVEKVKQEEFGADSEPFVPNTHVRQKSVEEIYKKVVKRARVKGGY